MVAAAVGLHWLTFACRTAVDQVCDRLRGGFAPVETIGGYGHPKSVCNESGARVFFGSKREDQPTVVNLPGEVCEGWAAEGIEWAEQLGAYVTRVDVACDLSPPELARSRMMELRRAWRAGRVDTRVRTFSEHRSEPPDGWTFYWGGKAANLRLRVYDRRGPLRLEFQARPERDAGERLPEIIARRGAASLWRGFARAIPFPVPWYRELCVGDAVQLAPDVSEDSAFLKVLEQLQLQLGATFWALSELGVTLDELATPPEQIRGDVAAKFLRWAGDATAEGYNGAKLESEVRCRLKSRRE